MPNSKFTYGWNVARIAAIILAFTIFFVTKAFAIGGEGFAPNLEFSNTEDKSHQELHQQQEYEEKQENAENFIKLNHGEGQDLSDREIRDACEWYWNDAS